MNKVALFYFSGTGNTAVLAKFFKREFETRKWEPILVAIDRDLIESGNFKISDYDLIGLGYPVHAFNAPKIVYDFIKSLPDGNGIRTFTFKCPGDPLLKAGSTHLVRNALTKKNYQVFHESLLVGPANVVIQYDNCLTRQLFLTAQKKINVRVDEIVNNTRRLQNNSLFLKAGTKLFSDCETMGAREFGKRIRTNNACTRCLKCIRICPEKNITLVNESIRFGKQCTFCMRCIYSCPVDAISPGFAKFIKIKEGIFFEKIGTDESIMPEFVSSKTKGYFGHFWKYFDEK
jgi:ferredoxin/flavodoxin